MHKENILHIKKVLSDVLPGWTAQKTMAPVASEKYRKAKPDSKKAAVMILLHPNEQGELIVVFIKRPSHNPQDKHSGQISFAGGQLEQADENLEATALRETKEELGITANDIQVLGALSSIYIYVSDFYVEPYVGYLDYQPEYNIQKEEVDQIVSIPLHNLLAPSTLKHKDHKVRNMVLKQMPYYDLNGQVLWGATAMITAEFLAVIK